MSKRKKIVLALGLALILPLVAPRLVGNAAAEVTAAFNETMRERAAEEYRRRNPVSLHNSDYVRISDC